MAATLFLLMSSPTMLSVFFDCLERRDGRRQPSRLRIMCGTYRVHRLQSGRRPSTQNEKSPIRYLSY
jgi:hypothetical protein